MIRADELKKVIEKGWSFRLGARGISADCYHMINSSGWCIIIPRAFTEIHADELKVVDDTDFYSLEVWRGGDMIADIDLSAYPLLTLPDIRMVNE